MRYEYLVKTDVDSEIGSYEVLVRYDADALAEGKITWWDIVGNSPVLGHFHTMLEAAEFMVAQHPAPPERACISDDLRDVLVVRHGRDWSEQMAARMRSALKH